MADEAQAAAEATEQESASSSKGGGKMKTMMLVGGLLVGEAAIIGGLLFFFGSPSEVQAIDLQGEIDPGDTAVEIPILHEKFTNTSTGRVWVWDIELMVVTKARYEEQVNEILGRNDATIRTGVGEIIAAASHQSFNEPGRPTLTRQLQEYLRRLVGRDMASGDEIVTGVLVPSCTGFPTDY